MSFFSTATSQIPQLGANAAKAALCPRCGSFLDPPRREPVMAVPARKCFSCERWYLLDPVRETDPALT